MTPTTPPLVACPDCDLLQREPELVPEGCADCERCGAELFRNKPHSIDYTLAFLAAAAIVFIYANAFPLMDMDTSGRRSSTTLMGTAAALQEAGMPSVSLLVLATAILIPAIELMAMGYMLLPLRLGHVPPGLRFAFRVVEWVRPWAMVEVFVLGALVAYVKLNDTAPVHVDPAFYALGLFVFLLAAADATFEPRAVWRCMCQLER